MIMNMIKYHIIKFNEIEIDSKEFKYKPIKLKIAWMQVILQNQSSSKLL